MAASYTCDGCGENVVKPIIVGRVIRRDYCDTCAAKANAFLEAEDTERLAMQSVFQGKRQKLIEVHGADNFKLPDVP